MRLVLLQSLHSMYEIGPVKVDDIPRQSNGDVVVGNAQQWGQKERESVCACLADLKRRIFFSRNRVGWWEFFARLLSPLCW